MGLNANIDPTALKALPRSIKVVAAVILANVAVLATTMLVLSDQLDEREARVQDLRGQMMQARRQVTDVRSKIDEYPELMKRYNDAVARGILGTMDRMKVVNDAQDHAQHYHLSDLHYRLQADEAKPQPGAKYRVASTLATFDSGALLDTDVLSFWDELLGSLPSHYQVVEVRLERLRDVDAQALGDIRAGRPVSLVNASMSFRWTVLRPATEGPP